MELKLNLKENKKQIKLVCEALANEKRLEIIESIQTLGEDISHRSIAEKLGVTSSSISFHLTPLFDAGIVLEDVGKGLKGRNKKVPRIKITKIVIEL